MPITRERMETVLTAAEEAVAQNKRIHDILLKGLADFMREATETDDTIAKLELARIVLENAAEIAGLHLSYNAALAVARERTHFNIRRKSLIAAQEHMKQVRERDFITTQPTENNEPENEDQRVVYHKPDPEADARALAEARRDSDQKRELEELARAHYRPPPEISSL